MEAPATLTETVQEYYKAVAELKEFREETKKHEEKLRTKVKSFARLINEAQSGLDSSKIDSALEILAIRGRYEHGGDDRASVISDAMKQLATEESFGFYKDLWRGYFGTKNYSGWRGQRSDHEYGFGPKHGSVCFSVGLRKDVRERENKKLTTSEIEACLYYLTNIERIQQAHKQAQEAA